MDEDFNHEAFKAALKPEHWIEEQILHTPTFEAQLQADGTLYLRGPALREGFSIEAVQALTRFLAERVTLSPVKPPYDFGNFTPTPIEFRVDDAHTRLDRAAEVVKGFHRRLTTVERRVLPYECISSEQKTHFTVTFWESDTSPALLATVPIGTTMPLNAMVFAMQQTGRRSADYVTVQTDEIRAEFYHVKLTKRAITYDRAVAQEGD